MHGERANGRARERAAGLTRGVSVVKGRKRFWKESARIYEEGEGELEEG